MSGKTDNFYTTGESKQSMIGVTRPSAAHGRMQLIRVHWEGSGYRVIRAGIGASSGLGLCNSLEQLGVMLRQFGVGQPDVANVFRQLESSAQAEVRI